MAVGTGYPFLSQLERTWYMTRVTGATPQTPLNQVKRMYWTSQTGGANPNVSMDELEVRWLKSVIVANGATPSTTNRQSALWREAVSSAGLTPSQFINDNKKKYFSSIAS